MKTDYRKLAMQILIDGRFSANNVAQQLAIKHPKVFCDLARPETKETPLDKKVKEILFDRGKGLIPALKYYREQVNCSLCEAKEYIDKLRANSIA